MNDTRREWTAREFAGIAGVDDSRIRQMLIAGDLNGRKRAGAWFVADDIESQEYLTRRKKKQAA